MRGNATPGLSERDLVGCTDDPAVFALFEQMCGAILAGTWRAGQRSIAA